LFLIEISPAPLDSSPHHCYNAHYLIICAFRVIERRPTLDNDERQEQILDAAARVIIRLGYDKTTMQDIAGEAGVSRRTVYLYFKGKEELFEALLYREWLLYAQTWLEAIESDPLGGTLGGFFRATMRAVNSRPLNASMMRRDRRVIGNYLRKPDNMFAWLETSSISADFIRALQAAGAVRQDLDPQVAAHIIEVLGYGQLTIADFKPADQFPPFEAVTGTIAEMMDRLLTPEDGGNSEAGKAVIRQIAAAVRERLEEMKQRRIML
jgi:TetR/AcrR family acrAB operon transcriptional repressor